MSDKDNEEAMAEVKETNYVDEDGNYVEVSFIEESYWVVDDFVDSLQRVHDVLDRESEMIQQRREQLVERLDKALEGPQDDRANKQRIVSLEEQIRWIEETQFQINERRFDIALMKVQAKTAQEAIEEKPEGWLEDPEEREEWVAYHRARAHGYEGGTRTFL